MAVKKTAAAETMVSVKKSDKPDLRSFLGEIEKRAYELYLDRKKSGVSGDEMTDWLRAEKETKAKYKI